MPASMERFGIPYRIPSQKITFTADKKYRRKQRKHIFAIKIRKPAEALIFPFFPVKAVELLIAVQAEHILGKNKIFEMYLNIIYFGNGIYWISDAARFYFGKDLKDLTDNKMFMLACMPTAPTKGNPIQYPDVFERIRNKVLDRFENNDIKANYELFPTQEQRRKYRSYDSSCLDPELRKNDSFTDNYQQTIVMTNERFGPFLNEKINLPQSEEGVV